MREYPSQFSMKRGDDMSIQRRVKKLESEVSQSEDRGFLLVSVADEDELAAKRAELADYQGFTFFVVGVDLDSFPEQNIGSD